MNTSLSTNEFMLVDCNKFYVSCQRAMEPRLEGLPVVVLSNGDGCAISISKEAKKLGIHMGAPWFKFKDLMKKHGIVALSSNYALYGDFSDRVTQILRMYSPLVEVYSIDESFLRLDGLNRMWRSHTELGKAVKQRVKQWTGIPVCAGIGSTKTLAKLANHLAKDRDEFDGVCDLKELSVTAQREYMRSMDIVEVWGVGRRNAVKLQALGIKTVQDLIDVNPKRLNEQFGVVLERTANELRGISCIELEEIPPDKKQTVSSRSFRSMISDYEQLTHVVSTYAARAAQKLRNQGQVCEAVNVFLETNRFREQDAQYNNSITIPLTQATNDTRRMTKAALYGLDRIFRANYLYKKAGVVAMALSNSNVRQGMLFGELDPKSQKLMDALDGLNARYGRDKVSLASAGIDKPWSTAFDYRTPRFTTSWDDLAIAYA